MTVRTGNRLGAHAVADSRSPERQGSHRGRGLMARFDEEANIGWATKLEDVGAHVVYGVVGYKVHARRCSSCGGKTADCAATPPGHRQLPPPHGAALLGFRTPHRQRRNHPRRQRGVQTAHRSLGQARTLKHLWRAPFTLQPNVIAAIGKKLEAARAGKRASSPR